MAGWVDRIDGMYSGQNEKMKHETHRYRKYCDR